MKAKYQVKGIIILLWYLQQKGIVEGEGVQREGGKEIKRSIQRESVERKALGSVQMETCMHIRQQQMCSCVSEEIARGNNN